jgi:hypothetical protein
MVMMRRLQESPETFTGKAETFTGEGVTFTEAKNYKKSKGCDVYRYGETFTGTKFLEKHSY